MANVNLFELEECLQSLAPFIQKHPEKPYIREHGRAVLAALDELNAVLKDSDTRYLEWRNSDSTAHLALKKVHRAYKQAQHKLGLQGAVGYPDYPVDYLDAEPMRAAAQEMIDWLRANGAGLDFADELIQAMSSALEHSRKGFAEGDRARQDYSRSVSHRIRALEHAEDVIRAMRIYMRSDLGRRSPDYQSVRWPAMLAPDPS